jgi:uncharacterized cupredoxin-like copper-binding protein
MAMRRRVWLVTAIVALISTAAACSGDEPSATPSTDPGIATTLSDFTIKPAEAEVPAGSITFDLTNDGPSDHSFYLARTDLAEDALPLADHVVETGTLEVVAEVERVAFDAEDLLSVDLEVGGYVMFCNIPGHYESDMHAAFTVT